MTIKNSLNQCEIIKKISDLYNVTANISSDLHVKQETNLNFSDQSVFTENFYMNLSKKNREKRFRFNRIHLWKFLKNKSFKICWHCWCTTACVIFINNWYYWKIERILMLSVYLVKLIVIEVNYRQLRLS